MLDLSIIIINWNQRQLVQKCLNSILQETEGMTYEIIVVDNASQDGSQAMLKEEFPHVTLVANSSNLGFGRANNIAFHQATGEYILLVNNDTMVLPGSRTIGRLITHLKDHSEIDVAGPKIVSPDGRIEPSCEKINFATQFLWEIIPLYRPIFHQIWRWKYARDESDKEVQSITGAFFIMKRSVLEDVGGFDEHYFLYCEEIDWCLRACRKGYRVFYLPRFTIAHIKTASGSGENLVRYFYHYYKSKNYFLKKFWPPRMAWLISILMVHGILFRYTAWSILLFLGIRKEKAELMRRAISGTLSKRKEVFLF